MLKKLQTVFGSSGQVAFALYLGYGFSDVFFWFIPGSWMTPCILLCGAGFYVLLRWLQAEKPKVETLSVAQDATVSRNSILRESLPTFSHLLHARVVAELVELLAPSRPREPGHNAPIEGLIARATPQLGSCSGPKKCCAGKGKLH